jgi:hypothetical protein
VKKHNANPLIEYFENNKGHLIHKWIHYFDIYHKHFQRFQKQPIVLLEFGVSHGGSLQMWKHYFGRKARIIGVDINPECKNLTESQVEIYIGSQEEPEFLKQLMVKIGPVDIVIDDGGHTMKQQLTTFDAVYTSVREGGVYLAEDLHTSYWSEFGGGLRKQGTFIEMAKDLIDQLHAWHSRDAESLKVNEFTRTTPSIHFYDSIIVFEKRIVGEPYHQQIGDPTLSNLEKWEYRNKQAKTKKKA